MRAIGALLIAALTGLVAVPFVFGDLAPWETVLLRVVIAAAIFVLGGFLVGLIAKHGWPLAAICAWSPMLMGLLLLLAKLGTDGTPPYWSAIGAFLLGPLLCSMLGGFFGSRFRSS